jgi:hypothetical protein
MPPTMPRERRRSVTRAVAAASNAQRERFPGRQLSVSLRHLRLGRTWKNGVEHSGSLRFADTEEVTGSNPVAPTIALLSRAFVDPAVPPMARGPVLGRHQRQESTSLFNQRVHFCGLPNL